MRVLIPGADVAGLTCAYWLHQAGHTPVVAERAQATAPLGGAGGATSILPTPPNDTREKETQQ